MSAPALWRELPREGKVEMLRRLRERNPPPIAPFPQWLETVTPQWRWDWAYQRHIQAHLADVTAGRCRKLMVFLPPRSGKSELVTIRDSAWRIEANPSTRVVIAAYGQDLADLFSRRARRLLTGRVPLVRSTAADWETEQGGGVRAVGVGAGITGHGFDILRIDDPVKSRAEADSPAYRDRVWDWYTDDLYTRAEPGASMVLCMTRWHLDDLAGRILASADGPNWRVVSLPAVAEGDDPLGRAPGEALCPDRYTRADLDERRTVLGRSFEALYQQRPCAPEGDLLKREWLQLVPDVPRIARRVRYWDKAASTDKGDYTAGVLLAEANGVYYVEDVVHGQWSPGARDAIMLQTAQLDRERYGPSLTLDGEPVPGAEPAIWAEQEGGSGGKDSAAATIRLLAGFPIRTETANGSKIARGEPFAAQAEAGNVRVKRAAWSSPYIEELTTFPNGAHDDMWDATAGAFNRLAVGNVVQVGGFWR